MKAVPIGPVQTAMLLFGVAEARALLTPDSRFAPVQTFDITALALRLVGAVATLLFRLTQLSRFWLNARCLSVGQLSRA